MTPLMCLLSIPTCAVLISIKRYVEICGSNIFTIDELANKGEFYLPVDHDNKDMLLDYFEGTEEYEKCCRIVNVIN